MSRELMKICAEEMKGVFSSLSNIQDYGRFLEYLISKSEYAVGFTGAGISTESGIPDYRSTGSLWKKNMPIPFDEFMRSEEARFESWRRKFAMDDAFSHAQPNTSHFAFANCVKQGKMQTVITQNIDGLHQAGGIKKQKAIIELHGNSTYAHCIECHKRYELKDIREQLNEKHILPTCNICGGIVKDAIVYFGQSMPGKAMAEARHHTLESDLFIVAGSSLVVYPAAGFPLMAKENGAVLVIINRDKTELDSYADFVIHTELGDILKPLTCSDFKLDTFSL